MSNKKTYLMSVNCFDIWVEGAGKKNAGLEREGISKALTGNSPLCLVKCVLQILPIHTLLWTSKVCGKSNCISTTSFRFLVPCSHEY